MRMSADEFRRIFRRAQRQDSDAFASLYLVHSQWLIALVHYGLGAENREDAEDIALAVWEKAWRRISKFPRYLPQQEESFTLWLRHLARNTAIAYKAHKRRQDATQESPHSYSHISIAFTPEGGWYAQRVEIQPLANTRASGQLQFTAYHPKEVQANSWGRLLFYVHRRSALEEVQSDSERRLGFAVRPDSISRYRRRRSLGNGAEITVLPEITGFQFNPRSVHLAFLEDWHCAEFRFRPQASRRENGKSDQYTGQISVYAGPLLIGEIAITVSLGKQKKRPPFSPRPRTRVSHSPYEIVFASYSHKDSHIVRELEGAYVALGLQYNRDVNILKSGQQWNAEILNHIAAADIFQLFWSRNSSKSTNVKREWTYALDLNRLNFIRPLYWQLPMPAPPKALRDINFSYLEPRK